jgi:Dolichyl-phosphate-mannose-protein mannosyltransferase
VLPPSWPERLAVAALAAGAAVLALVIAWSVLGLVPHVTDCVSYLFQGRILAAGHLYEPPPRVPALFWQENVILDATRWCSKYPPGWPLLLALGWRLHAPWLMSPLLLALAVAGVWLAGRRLYDPATGLLAAAMLACSPFALLMAADAMAHVPALCATAWCLAMIAGVVGAGAEAAGRGRRGTLIAIGLLAGFAWLIRPGTAAAVLAPALAWCLAALGRRRRLAGLAWMALGAAPCLAAMAAYDTVVFGGPLVTGYAVYEPARYARAADALVPWSEALLHRLPWYLDQLNRSLWGFPWGDLLLLAPLLLARPRRAADGVLAACAGSLVLAHCFYFYGDVIYSGPRMAFESLGPLSLLAARSLRTLAGWFDRGLRRLGAAGRQERPEVGSGSVSRGLPLGEGPKSYAPGAWAPRPKGGRGRLNHYPEEGTPRTLRLAAAAAAGCLLLYFPLGRRLPRQMVRHAGWYATVSPEPLRAGVRAGLGPDALVFVAGNPWCYSAFFLANDLRPEAGRRVFVRDVPPLRAAALAAYPRREVWLTRVDVVIPDPVSDPDVARPTLLSWQRLR